MADMDPEERAYAECTARLDALREEAAKAPAPKTKKTDALGDPPVEEAADEPSVDAPTDA